MEYRRFKDTLVLRIDRGEEIVEQLRRAAEKEDIKLATVQAIAGISELNFGIYDAGEQQYHPQHMEGFFEVISLLGTINTMNGEYYSHLHISVSDESGHAFGGHLNSAVVGATCEMVVRVIDGQVDRKRDDETGLNLFCF